MFFIENADGSCTKHDGEFTDAAMEPQVVAAYIVSEKIARTAAFSRESLVPKTERKFRCRDGQLRTKSEMSEDDIVFLKEKMAKARAARVKATS